jgi:hypothetical protein
LWILVCGVWRKIINVGAGVFFLVSGLDEEGFRGYLKGLKKPEGTIGSYVKRVGVFEGFLVEGDSGRGLGEATRGDLEEFASGWGRERGLNVYQYLWGVKFYYSFLGDAEMRNASDELKEWVQLEKYRLRDFMDVDKGHVKGLGSIGIRTARELLDRGRTVAQRGELENDSGVPQENILELVKLANLARIGGLKKKRARLFYDAGFDTLDKIAGAESGELIDALAQHIERTGFDGRASSESEAEHTVTMTKFLQRIIEY